jgi:hypothetical protein
LIETTDLGSLQERLREQRRRVMLEHNLFAVADRLIAARRDLTGLLPAAVEIARSSRFTGRSVPGK